MIEFSAKVMDVLPSEDVQGKDTESYYTVLYEGKSNRWLFRYWGNKARPNIAFCLPLSESHKAEIKRAKLDLGAGDTILIDKPEHLLRLAGLLNDALEYCKDDNNFKRASAPT